MLWKSLGCLPEICLFWRKATQKVFCPFYGSKFERSGSNSGVSQFLLYGDNITNLDLLQSPDCVKMEIYEAERGKYSGAYIVALFQPL